VKTIAEKGDLAVTVDLTEPWANFPILLASQVGVVGDPDWLESKDSLKPIGTGPFTFDTWEIGNKLTVKKNGTYWRKDKDGIAYPYLDTIEFRPMSDPDSRAKAFKAKDIDIMETYSGSQIADFRTQADAQVFSNPKGEIAEDFVLLNTQAPPFDDVDARRALAYATDKKTFIDLLNGGSTEAANGIFQPSSPWYADSGYPQYDPAKAKELVDKVKAKHGSFTFEAMASPSQDGQRGQQILQQQWADVGIDVQLKTVEQATIIINVVTGNFQATNWLQFSAPDPVLDSLWIDPKLATKPPAFSLNFSRLQDEEMGAAYRKARASSDAQVRKQAFADVQKRMSDQIPFVFLFHQQVAVVASSRVQNIVNWTLPDGAKGIDIQEGAHPVYQLSLKS
jgi:ABC-type transport system substrate-binding protein